MSLRLQFVFAAVLALICALLVGVDLTHDRSTKNDARSRAAWMVLTGGEKAPEKVAILRFTEPDDTGRFGRF